MVVCERLLRTGQGSDDPEAQLMLLAAERTDHVRMYMYENDDGAAAPM